MEHHQNVEKEEIAKVFKVFDDDNREAIDAKKIRRVAKLLGEEESLSEEIIHLMVLVADADCDGVVNFNDFYNLLAEKKRPKVMNREDYL